MDINYLFGQQPLAVPVIAKVMDSLDTELGNPGTTSDTALSLSGSATPSAVVIILDDGRPIGSASVRADGGWTVSVTAALGDHHYVARVIGDGDSTPWDIRVQAAEVKPLTIDTSTLYLNGMIMVGSISELTGQFPSGTTAVRQARGGVPPYQYTASSKAVAVIDPTAGLIRSAMNGSSVITVTDQASQSASYSVVVTNVYNLLYWATLLTHPEYVALAATWGGTPMTEAMFASIALVYRQPFTRLPRVSRWNCTAGSCGANGQLYLESEQRIICEYADRLYGGWCVKPYNLSSTTSLNETLSNDLPRPTMVEAFDISALTLPLAITQVTDSTGELTNPDSTSDTELTLSGTATENAVVIINNSGRPIGSASVKSDGTWEIIVRELEQRSHSFTVKLSGGGESSAWVITVRAVGVRPAITQVVDSTGAAIPQNSNTFDSSVTLSGTAKAGASIEIDDGAVSWGTTPAPGGTWTKTLNGLTAKAYSMTAKDVSDVNQPVSDAWAFTVAVATAPTITRVQDSTGAVIPHNGTTSDTRVTIIGTALANEDVSILDGSEYLATVTAVGENWTSTFSTQVKSYSIKARGQYGGNPESGVRAFRVDQATPPLVIDTSPVTLSGKFYGLPAYPGHAPANWPENTTITRVPTGGVAPYSYISSDPSVAAVNSTGFVNVTTRKGMVTITVRDSAQQTASYTVSVTGVVSTYGLGNDVYNGAVNKAAAQGLRIPTMAELNEIHAIYSSGWPMGNALYWSSDKENVFPCRMYTLNLVTSGWQGAPCTMSYANIVAI